MASNFTFGLITISNINEILVLLILAQTIVLFSLLSYYLYASEDTF